MTAKPGTPIINLQAPKNPLTLLIGTSGAIIKKKAATYSPTLHCSTIGAGGLNCSVRNGKRRNPAAIATGNSATSLRTSKTQNN